MKYCIILLFGIISIGNINAQLYYPDPTIITPAETQTLNNMFEGLMNSYNQFQQNLDNNSSASVNYMYDGNEFTAYLTYTGASPAKVVYQSSVGSRATLEKGVDYFPYNGLIVVTYSLNPGSMLFVYNGNTSKILAKGKIPEKSSSQFRIFQAAAVANLQKFQSLISF